MYNIIQPDCIIPVVGTHSDGHLIFAKYTCASVMRGAHCVQNNTISQINVTK